MVNKLLNRVSKFIVPLLLMGGLVFPTSALADVYGGGNYGNCKYSQGCTSTGAPASGGGTSTTTQQSGPSIILLNNFDEYFSDTGKQLDLKKGDVIYFEVTANNETVRYSITVTNVGSDFADVTVGDLKLVFNVGESKNIDVNGDGENDISITLNSIQDGKANFTFKVLGASTTKPSSAAIAAAAPKSHLGLWLSIAAIITALLIFLILFLMRRRKKDNNQQMPPGTTFSS